MNKTIQSLADLVEEAYCEGFGAARNEGWFRSLAAWEQSDARIDLRRLLERLNDRTI